jgi:hypothetical protein
MKHPTHGAASRLQTVLHEVGVVENDVFPPHPAVIVVIGLDGGNLAVLAPDLMDAVARAAIDDATRIDGLLVGVQRFKPPDDGFPRVSG